MPRFNPYRPNGLVTAGMFCGRWEELTAVEQSLFQTKHGNPKHFLVEGERGIGKSSLMLFVESCATGKLAFNTESQFSFIVVSLDLAGTTSYEDFIQRLTKEFKAKVAERHRIKHFTAKTWDFVTNWKVFGVEYKKQPLDADSNLVIDQVATLVSTFLEQTKDEIDGLVILLDEADKPSEQARLGEFAKLFTEKLTKLGCERVCLGLAGLPILIPKLRSSHESALRIFETLSLEPLKADECEEVIRRGLADAKEKNAKETTIAVNALKAIVSLSEGYPHFIQQFSYSAFEHDSDGHITVDDVNTGAFKENGALDQLGKRFFNELYFDRVSSEDYRRVLNTMAESLDAWTSRSAIIQKSGVKETQVTNALATLKNKNIILSNDKRKGEYRLPTKSFAVWIKALNIKQQIERF
jgi:hypothetical protein